MLSYFQGIILGALPGDLGAVSDIKSGHSVILPQLLGWNTNEQSPFFLMFLVATHFATALVLLLYFWKDWVRIVKGLFRSLRDREIGEADQDAKLGWLLVAGTIPAGILGLIFKDQIQQYFITARSAAVFLMLNGFLLAGLNFCGAGSGTDCPISRKAMLASRSFRFGRGSRWARCRYSRSSRDFRVPVPRSRAGFSPVFPRRCDTVFVPPRDADHRRGCRS